MLVILLDNACTWARRRVIVESIVRDVNIVITVDKPADNRLRVSVSDDGVGLKAGLGSGLGLANIREQLVARFGDKASLTIAALPEAGTIATIELPVSDNKA